MLGVFVKIGAWIMGILKVAYFIYFVKDMERAKAFYRDTLRLEIGYETPAWVQFKSEGGTLALHLSHDDDDSAETSGSDGGIIGFQVDDMDAFAAYLKERHVSFKSEIRNERFGRLLDIMDPDGNTINLFEPAHMAMHS
jgi:catechol 2,3-dioxygenase-like lactoylglutathione lyase family enzyme